MKITLYLQRLCFVLGLGMTICSAEPVKVFILAGQSNMLGYGTMGADFNKNDGKGSLEYLAKNNPKYAHLMNGSRWVERDDVMIWSLFGKGKLGPGYGGGNGDRFGPEVGFGEVVGEAIDGPVLLIKISWGGKSLVSDFRPPSAGGTTGPKYLELVDNVKKVLADLPNEFPEFNEGHELVGFAWHQGWNDGGKMSAVEEYPSNFKHLVRDLRKEFNAPEMLVTIANSGMGGMGERADRRIKLREEQLKIADDPEFKKTMGAVDTVPFHRPAEESPSKQGYHWNSNAETYLLIGEALGAEMLKLMGSNPKEVKLKYRIFRSADGSKSFEASLVKFDEATGKVEVVRKNGKRIIFDLKFLHEEDQAFVKGS